MPSTNKTSKLKLNSWVAEDRPMRNDFNSDNAIIDSALGGHISNAGIHVTAEEKAYLQDSHLTFMYTGTGVSERKITLSDKVRFVMVFAANKPAFSSGKSYFAVGYSTLGASEGLAVSATADGLTVYQTETAALNETGVQYKIVAFK